MFHEKKIPLNCISQSNCFRSNILCSDRRCRFSLQLLEPGEIYFEDYSVDFLVEGSKDKSPGRLKLCSKSLIFEPHDIAKPILKILFQHCGVFENNNNVLFIACNMHVELLKDNIIAPYIFKNLKSNFLFSLHYNTVDDCLSQILQLQRASTLPPPEHNSMVAAIAFSRQSRLKFDMKWLEDLYETVLLELEGKQVSPLVVNPGRIVLSSEKFYFQPFNNADLYPVLRINLEHIQVITRRRFLQRQVGIELFCEGAAVPHLYLVMKTQEDREKLYDALLCQPKLSLNQLQPEIMTLKWQNCAISNYEYLLYLNSLADRSFNDLTQYPVFPWVISDYTSPHLDMADPRMFRDLSKPIGALNTERLERLKERRSEMETPSFLYGSHYSTPGFVLFYLVRKFPQYMLCLQNGRFDHPDRIFHSTADVWRNILKNMADFKELIPEFYDTDSKGDFLVNAMGVDLGMRQDGQRVRDVVLPPWCDGPADFVQKLRNALESDIVSRGLPAWINLVFGYKQRGKAAEEADNVFYHLCYEGAVDLDSVPDLYERHALEVQIMEFGQIPKQIFTVPHPQRLKPNILPSLPPPGIFELKNVTATTLATHKENITAVACYNDIAISVGRDSLLKEFRCSVQEQVRSIHIESAGISACIILPCATVVLGTFDNRILMYDLECSKIVDEIQPHEDAVSCLCYSSQPEILVSGSWDASVRIFWQDTLSHLPKVRLFSAQTYRFVRESKITCVALDKSAELTACGTEDGDVAIFSTLSTSSILLDLPIHSSSVTAVAFCGSRVISCSTHGFKVHDIPSGLNVFSTPLSLPIMCLAWSGHTLFLGTSEGIIETWDMQQVKQLESLPCSDFPITSLAVTSCAHYLLSGEGRKMVLRSILM